MATSASTAAQAPAVATLPPSSPSPSFSSSANVTYARRDGRTALELRGKEMKLSEMTSFDGSCWYAQGQTAVMVTLHGPTLAKNEIYDTCLLRVRVQHAKGIVPAAGGAERAMYEEMKLEALTRTDALELASLLESTIDAVFMRDRFPRCVLVVDVIVMQDDGSLAAVALNAVMCALLDAGLPCRTTMAAVSVAAVRRVGASAAAGVPSPAHTQHPSDESSSAVEFLLDPTTQEETLMAHYSGNSGLEGDASTSMAAAVKGGGGGGAGGGTASVVGQPSASSSSSSSAAVAAQANARGVMSVLGRDASRALQAQYGCISSGVFIFSNPACGGGLLGQLVRRRAAQSQRGASSNAHGSSSSGGGGSVAGLSLESYSQMMVLAERAATVLFEFFRQCNVAE